VIGALLTDCVLIVNTLSDGCTTKFVHGILYNPLSKEWNWSSSTSITYALQAVKRQQWLQSRFSVSIKN